jgi:hypothetical protein
MGGALPEATRVETGLEGLRGDIVQHRTNVVVGRYLLDSEEGVAIRGNVPLLQPTLMEQKRFILHEKQGKRRKSNIRHRVVHVRTAPSIWQSCAHPALSVQKRFEYLQTSTEHCSTLGKIATWVPIFI